LGPLASQGVELSSGREAEESRETSGPLPLPLGLQSSGGIVILRAVNGILGEVAEEKPRGVLALGCAAGGFSFECLLCAASELRRLS